MIYWFKHPNGKMVGYDDCGKGGMYALKMSENLNGLFHPVLGEIYHPREPHLINTRSEFINKHRV